MDGAQEGRQSSAEHMEVAPADMDTLGKKQQKNTEDKWENYPSSRTKVWHVCFQIIGSLDIIKQLSVLTPDIKQLSAYKCIEENYLFIIPDIKQ